LLLSDESIAEEVGANNPMDIFVVPNPEYDALPKVEEGAESGSLQASSLTEQERTLIEAREHTFSEFKWESKGAYIDHIARRYLTRYYINYILLLACAELTNRGFSVVNLKFTYPLSFGDYLSQFQKVLEDVVQNVSSLTGMTMNLDVNVDIIGESIAAWSAIGIPPRSEIALVADLGGSTLDVAIGEIAKLGEIPTLCESIRYGGIRLIDIIAESLGFVLNFGNTDGLRLLLVRISRQGTAALKQFIKGTLKKVGKENCWPHMQTIAEIFFVSMVDYLSSLCLGAISEANLSEFTKPIKISFLPIGKGWELYGLCTAAEIYDNPLNGLIKELNKSINDLGASFLQGPSFEIESYHDAQFPFDRKFILSYGTLKRPKTLLLQREARTKISSILGADINVNLKPKQEKKGLTEETVSLHWNEIIPGKAIIREAANLEDYFIEIDVIRLMWGKAIANTYKTQENEILAALQQRLIDSLVSAPASYIRENVMKIFLEEILPERLMAKAKKIPITPKKLKK
jgi:hypothetical protein